MFLGLYFHQARGTLKIRTLVTFLKSWKKLESLSNELRHVLELVYKAAQTVY